MNLRLVLFACLVFIVTQGAFAQKFIKQLESNGLSLMHSIDVYESRVIASGSMSVVAGVGAENYTFFYDESLDSTYVLDMYDLNGVWKQEIKDSLLLLLGRELDNKTGALVKYNLNTAEPDSVHLKPPLGWNNMVIGDMHIADDHLFIASLVFNPSSVEAQRTNIPAIFKFDFDLNLVNTFLFEEITPFSSIVSLSDDGNNLKIVVNRQDVVDGATPPYVNNLYSVSFSGEVINTLFTIRSDSRISFPFAGGNYPMSVTRSGNILFGVDPLLSDTHLWGIDQMVLHCVSPTGELLWTYQNFAENRWAIDARAYHVEDIHLLEDGTILLSGFALRKSGHERFFHNAFLTSLNENGSHNWTKMVYYKPGYEPEAHAETLSFDPTPMASAFRGVGVGPSGDIYAAGNAYFVPRFNDQSVSISEDAVPLFARLDAEGCLTPQCETETIIGEPAVPNTTVVPGRSWIEQHWSGMDTLTSFYRYAVDSIYEAGRYYVPIEIYNPATARYEPTEYAMRELTGMTIVRWDSVDHIINDKLMEVGDQAPFVTTYPGNIPFLPVQFRVLERDSVVTYDGETRLRMLYDCPEFSNSGITYTWVDGIGRLEGMFSVFEDCGEPIRSRIACVRDGDNIIYKAGDFENCDIISSISHTDEIRTIYLFPNPTSSEFNITNLPPGSEVTLYDSRGGLILRTQEATVDVSRLPGGVYYAKIVFSGQSLTRKLVVRN